jgi:hypothetical protein
MKQAKLIFKASLLLTCIAFLLQGGLDELSGYFLILLPVVFMSGMASHSFGNAVERLFESKFLSGTTRLVTCACLAALAKSLLVWSWAGSGELLADAGISEFLSIYWRTVINFGLVVSFPLYFLIRQLSRFEASRVREVPSTSA